MDDEEEDEEDKDAVASEPPFKASLFAFLEFSDSFRVNNLAGFFLVSPALLSVLGSW